MARTFFQEGSVLTVVLTSPYVFSILSIIWRNKAPYGFMKVHFYNCFNARY